MVSKLAKPPLKLDHGFGVNIGINLFILVIVLIKFYYVNKMANSNEKVPNFVIDMFSNHWIKLFMILFIVVASIGAGGVGGPWLGILLSILFLMLNTIVNSRNIKETFAQALYNTEHFEDHEQEEYQVEGFSEQEEDTPVGKAYHEKELPGATTCGPYAPINAAFNPEAIRPNESVLASGVPDIIPPTGVDFNSDPSGPYTDSGIAYQFDMA